MVSADEHSRGEPDEARSSGFRARDHANAVVVHDDEDDYEEGGDINRTSSSSSYTYRDFSRDRPDPSSHNKESAQTFPMKLHSILSNPEFNDVIAFLPHGRAWRILQHKAFEERVIPLYFRHGRYSSFARQVNGWGFRRITHGPDYNSYYHELFLRGLPHLCLKMKRLTSTDIKKAQQEDVPLPDFYALSREHPLPESPSDAAASPKSGPSPQPGGPASPPESIGPSSSSSGMAGRWQQQSQQQSQQPQQQQSPPRPGTQTSQDLPLPPPSLAALQNLQLPTPASVPSSDNQSLDRRAELMQRLIGMNGQGGASSQASSNSGQNQPRHQAPPAPSATPGVNANLLALLQQQGLPANLLVSLTQSLNAQSNSNPAPAVQQPAPAPSMSTANPPSNMNLPPGLDLASLLRQVQAPNQAPAAAPVSGAPPPAQNNLNSIAQLLSGSNDPNTAALLLQMQLTGGRVQAPQSQQPPAAASGNGGNSVSTNATQSILQALAAAAQGGNAGGMTSQPAPSAPPPAPTSLASLMASFPGNGQSAPSPADTAASWQRQILEAQLAAAAANSGNGGGGGGGAANGLHMGGTQFPASFGLSFFDSNKRSGAPM